MELATAVIMHVTVTNKLEEFFGGCGSKIRFGSLEEDEDMTKKKVK